MAAEAGVFDRNEAEALFIDADDASLYMRVILGHVKRRKRGEALYDMRKLVEHPGVQPSVNTAVGELATWLARKPTLFGDVMAAAERDEPYRVKPEDGHEPGVAAAAAILATVTQVPIVVEAEPIYVIHPGTPMAEAERFRQDVVIHEALHARESNDLY